MRINYAPRSAYQSIEAPLTKEGGNAFIGTPEQQLRRSIMTCMLWEDSFYESGISIADRIAGLIPKVPFDALSQIAIDAREKQKLRHVPLLIAASASAVYGGKQVGDLVARIIQRPDECGELVAICRKISKKRMVPRQVKLGIGRALRKFDEYSLAKWDQSRADFSLADVIRLCHVRAGENRDFALLLARIANKTFIPEDVKARYEFGEVQFGLSTPDTWETKLSAGADKKATFERLISEGKLGAMALLRNLRGMTEAGVEPTMIRHGLAMAKADRLLPFRFIAAANAAPTFQPELEALMLKCLEGREKLKGKTILLVDVSGSMAWQLSQKSAMTRSDAANGLAIILREICEDVRIISFSDKAVGVPTNRGFALAHAISRSQINGGTSLGRAVAAAANIEHDRLIIITDEQARDVVGGPPSGSGYMINVSVEQHGVGYGPWHRIDGWSEAIADYILEVERPATKSAALSAA